MRTLVQRFFCQLARLAAISGLGHGCGGHETHVAVGSNVTVALGPEEDLWLYAHSPLLGPSSRSPCFPLSSPEEAVGAETSRCQCDRQRIYWKPGGRPCGFRYYRALGFLAHGPAPSPPAPSQMCLFVEACSAWLPAWFPAICAMAALSALSANWNLSPVHSTHPQGALLQAVLGAANYLGLRII